MKAIEYTAEARQDLLQALSYYEDDQEGLASDFYKEVVSAEQSIRELPEFWHQFSENYRRKHLKRYPFSLVYRITTHCIVIVAVAHSSRAPNYWT